MLITEGWKFNDDGDLVGYATNVLPFMFKMMGKTLSDPKVSVWAWPPCIIEEVEDDERAPATNRGTTPCAATMAASTTA